MGYQQRERKRKKKVAIARAQRESRRTGSSARKWWLTVVSKHTCCARCGGVLREGRQMVYRHTPGESLCLACAEDDPAVKWRPAARWERSRRRERRHRGIAASASNGTPTSADAEVAHVTEKFGTETG